MGTICVLSYANIYMGKFKSTHIYRYIREKTITCLRYIEQKNKRGATIIHRTSQEKAPLR